MKFKKQTLFSLAIAASVLASCSSKQTENTESNAALDNIMTRTSIRAYTADSISKENIETMLRAAMAAPSAGNKQPWRFVVIENRATLDSIGANFGSMKMASQASLGIVVCGDLEATFPEEGRDYWIEDTSAAMENLLLAAHSIGLGAVWCGIYPMTDRVQAFSEMLSLPENIIPMGVAIIGHPQSAQEPKDKWNPEYVHYESWKKSGAKGF